MTHFNYRTWRKVSVLSATFLFCTLLVFSCKKRESQIGKTGFDPTSLLAAGAIDTFSLFTSTVLDDSISTKNVGLNVLGDMNDAIFGRATASFYTQIRLANTNPSFGNLSDIVLDSFILSMEYATTSTFSGVNVSQTFEVFEIDEAIERDSNYFEYSTRNVKPTNLIVPSRATFVPAPTTRTLVDTSLVSPQMRLSLDTNFARSLLVESSTGSSFASNDAFTTFFKGFRINTNNSTMSPGQGAVYAFNMNSAASKLTIYYRQKQTINGMDSMVVRNYDFVVNTNAESFNHVEFDRTGSKVAQYLGDLTKGQEEFYSQAFGLRAVISIPGLSNLPKNAVIQKAVLDLPYQFQTGSTYSVGTSATLFLLGADGVPLSNFALNPALSEFTKSVNTDIRSYAQAIVSGNAQNIPYNLTVVRRPNSMDRIIFNGTNTTFKKKPKLYIIYTQF